MVNDMEQCKCGSYAINPEHHGRGGTDADLCDVCYWRKRADIMREALEEMDNAEEGCSVLFYQEIVRECLNKLDNGE